MFAGGPPSLTGLLGPPSPGLPSRSSRFGVRSRERRLAEREGFEPPEPFPVQWFSRPPPSTTRPSLRMKNYSDRAAEPVAKTGSVKSTSQASRSHGCLPFVFSRSRVPSNRSPAAMPSPLRRMPRSCRCVPNRQVNLPDFSVLVDTELQNGVRHVVFGASLALPALLQGLDVSFRHRGDVRRRERKRVEADAKPSVPGAPSRGSIVATAVERDNEVAPLEKRALVVNDAGVTAVSVSFGMVGCPSCAITSAALLDSIVRCRCRWPAGRSRPCGRTSCTCGRFEREHAVAHVRRTRRGASS